MNYEEYVVKFTEIQIDIDYLKDQINILMGKQKDLKDKYIEVNAKFKIGDRVKVFKKSDFNPLIEEFKCEAFISARGLDYDGKSIKYEFVKVKKDGTPSKQSAAIYFYDRIEPTTLTEDQLIHLQFKMKEKL